MKKLLVGYVAVTLFGIILIVLESLGIVDKGSMLPSGAGFFIIFTIPEFFFVSSLLPSTPNIGRFQTGMIPMFLFLSAVKLSFVYSVGSLLSYLWNFKLEDVS